VAQPSSPDAGPAAAAQQTVLKVLLALSFSHLLNDTIQALLPAIYPLLKQTFRLSFTQIGLITLTNQATASLLQPVIGTYTDLRPKPYSLAIGMTFTLAGIVLLSQAGSFETILIAAVFIGTGSSVFHPEASRVAHMAAGGRHGFAQSLFQVGGNLGSSFGPLLAALIIVPRGQASILWFSLAALMGIAVLIKVGGWYSRNIFRIRKKSPPHAGPEGRPLSRRQVGFALAILLTLIFSKYFYLVSLTNYYTFFLINRFNLPVQKAQMALFLFMFSVAAGTIIGGPLGDRFGRKYVIWFSILGVAPFSLALPHVGLVPALVLTVFIGVILASAFSAIIVYAQELVPGKVGMIAGLFFGFAFGIGGIASATLGRLADRTSIGFVFEVCAFLPLIGLITAFLPNIEGARQRKAA